MVRGTLSSGKGWELHGRFGLYCQYSRGTHPCNCDLFVAADLELGHHLDIVEKSRSTLQLYRIFGIQALRMPNYLLSGESFLQTQ